MKKRVGVLTTEIIGDQEQFDEKDHAHARAPRKELGEQVFTGYTTESLSPFYRMCFPRTRGQNSLTRTLVNYVDGPVNPERAEIADPGEMSLIMKGVARHFGADVVGICRLDKAYVYRRKGSYTHFLKGGYGDPIDLADRHQYAITMGFPMKPEMTKATPSFIESAEVCKWYTFAAVTAVLVAQYIREIGYSARAHFCLSEEVIQPPLAVMSGLGELGRCGFVISPEFGPSMRLATVTTDLPLGIDQPVDYGITRICEICKKCARNCPGGALTTGDKSVIRGVRKWPNDQERCMRFWTRDHSKYDNCGRCIGVCPLNKPNTWWHRLAWVGAQRSKLFVRLLLQVDDLIWGKRPVHKFKWLNYEFPAE